MTLRRIIFWQPIDSPHQDAFLEAVAEQFDGEVILGVERPFPPERAVQGWREPVHERVTVTDISVPANHAALAAHDGADSLHVFTGFFSHPLVWRGFHALAPSQARLAIYSEAPEEPAGTGWLKRLRGRHLASRWASRIEFVLAIGGIGSRFFERIGFPREKIVPFGYYLAPPPATHDPVLAAALAKRTDRRVPSMYGSSDAMRFVAAGQFIRRKGFDLLIEACCLLPPDGWHLDIYGNGPERDVLRNRLVTKALWERISLHHTVHNRELERAIELADCVVVPSRFDGWGAIVSEALGCGTPVICTNRCGAAALVEQVLGASHVTNVGALDIATALHAACARGHTRDHTRERLRLTIEEQASPAHAAARLLERVRTADTPPRSRTSSRSGHTGDDPARDRHAAAAVTAITPRGRPL